MIDLDIRLDTTAVEKAFRTAPRAAKKAVVSTLKKTTDKAHTEADRKIRSRYTLRKADISKTVTKSYASFNKLVSTISIKGRRTTLLAFRGRQTKKGATFQMLKGAGRKRLDGTFILKVGRFQSIFKRRYSGKRVAGKSASIRPLFGPSVPQLYGDDVVMKRIKRVVNTYFPKEFKRRFQYLMSRISR